MELKFLIIILLIIIFFKKRENKYIIKVNDYYQNYINDISDIKKLKKVIYTALLGKYDNIPPINKEKGYDYFLFTDISVPDKNNLNWTIIPIEDNIKNSNISIYKKQRYYKTHPHLYFQNYDLSIYIDTTIEIKGNLDEFLLKILSPNISIYTLEHPDRNSINNELDAVVFALKESKVNSDIVRNRYNRENYTYDNGLSENCLIVRKHNDLNCINFMNQWYYEIKHYSHRDQLSFNYVLWKLNNKYVKYIPKIFIYDYFKQNLFHLKLVIFKNM